MSHVTELDVPKYSPGAKVSWRTSRRQRAPFGISCSVYHPHEPDFGYHTPGHCRTSPAHTCCGKPGPYLTRIISAPACYQMKSYCHVDKSPKRLQHSGRSIVFGAFKFSIQEYCTILGPGFDECLYDTPNQFGAWLWASLHERTASPTSVFFSAQYYST
jgi:hypothetical protein